MALILGAVLDGIPESIVLGLTLIGGEGIGITVLIAILLSNLPEGIAGTRDLVEIGLDRRPHHADLDDCRRRVRVRILRGVCRVRERIP